MGVGSEREKKLGLFRNKTHGGLFLPTKQKTQCEDVVGRERRKIEEGDSLGIKVSELNWERMRSTLEKKIGRKEEWVNNRKFEANGKSMKEVTPEFGQ